MINQLGYASRSSALKVAGVTPWASAFQADTFLLMELPFAPGDDLIFQLESGFGLLRVIAIDHDEDKPIWHLMAYEELFPDVEAAEKALNNPSALHVRMPHMALTERAFERTPAARLGNRAVSDDERAQCENWIRR